MPTPSQRLADALLPIPLAEYVHSKRTSIPRWSWRLIAQQLSTDTNGAVTVTDESLRRWFPDDTQAVA
jgi:hypothetical protein